jgi:hypothetical protein
MDVNASKLQQLRPVTFHLRSEPQGTLQYGLIAEEVDKIYPDLVLRDAAGRIEGVRYDELAPLLLKEVQTQSQALVADEAKLDEQRDKLASDDVKIATQQQQLNDLQQQFAQLIQVNTDMQTALAALTAKGLQMVRR